MPKYRPRELRLLPQVRADIEALPSQLLKRVALQRLTDIRAGRLRGEPLSDRARTGPLGDCLKVYFDEDGAPQPRFRIVYRELREGRLEVAEIAAVEQRQASYVYQLTASRLGRLPEGEVLPSRPLPERRSRGGHR